MLDGDEQAYRRVRGGPDKVNIAYSHDNYAAWRIDLGEARLGRTGVLGENLTVTELDEHTNTKEEHASDS